LIPSIQSVVLNYHSASLEVSFYIQSLSLIYQYFWTPHFHASYGLLTVELHFHALFRIKSLTVALFVLPSRNGQTRPLVVDSLQLISIYDIYSIHFYLFYLFSYSPPIGFSGMQRTIVISSYYISRRQRRCSLVSKYYQQPQLLINFVSIVNAWHDSFSRPNYSALRGSHLMHIFLILPSRLTLQFTECNFILLLLYISILLAWLHTSYVLLVL